MTTVLAVMAVVLLAVLTAVCVFGYLRLSAMLKEDKKTDEAECSKPYEIPYIPRSSGRYPFWKEDFHKAMVRIDTLERLVKQLYSDRDEDVNKIADQINRHEVMLKEMKDDYEKRFQNISELTKEYAESFESVDDWMAKFEAAIVNDEAKAEWLRQRNDAEGE